MGCSGTHGHMRCPFTHDDDDADADRNVVAVRMLLLLRPRHGLSVRILSGSNA